MRQRPKFVVGELIKVDTDKFHSRGNRQGVKLGRVVEVSQGSTRVKIIDYTHSANGTRAWSMLSEALSHLDD